MTRCSKIFGVSNYWKKSAGRADQSLRARTVLMHEYADVVVHATDGVIQSASPRQVGLAFGSGSTCKGHKEPALRDRREPPGISNCARTLHKDRGVTIRRSVPAHANGIQKA